MEDAIDTANVIVYTKDNCSPCRRAKRVLEALGVRYVTVDLTGDIEGMFRVARMAGRTTLPLVVVGNELIGGADELELAIHNPRIREALLAASDSGS